MTRLDFNTISTYIKLPLLHAGPSVCYALNNDWFAASLIPLNKLFYCQIIYVNALNGVCESLGIVDFEKLILAAPIAILRPLAQKQIASMFRLHIVHLLDEWTRHFSCSEDRVGKSCLSGIGDGFVIDHVLKRQLFEELLSALQIRCRFQIGLLILVLL